MKKGDVLYVVVMALIAGLLFGSLIEDHFSEGNPLPNGCTVTRTDTSTTSWGTSADGAVLEERTLYLVECE